ncbi:TylF/MycF/NovP-related O-methyltransferase [Blastochloris viridis]|uniref:Macrocin-O-methyltransferase (TylF) n=1 Tax=Blastochloris viridis TaxID=1079 RepID=A0A0P0IUH9_BLAVI|nr:TylF/MycF/NovP-related O-methyltransferase [Blastochloris viridis]ALK09521.1 Macrocin O-methyltransferase [Blastochloris viridis]CUU42184.1 Macrocin-O-methyltransferase (TylF) [Blastochloris viridis]
MPRTDQLDPLLYGDEWPSLRSATGRVDVHSLAAFWARESKVPGHYFEFGVGAGRSAVSALRAAAKHNLNIEFHLFDSFEGLPPLEGLDADSRQFQQGQFSFGVDQVKEFLRQHDVHALAPIHFYKTWFSALDTIEIDPAIRAAIVHIDCDLYSSALQVLNFIGPRLESGTILLFDDFNAFNASNDRGERRALSDWIDQINNDPASPMAELTPYVSYGWHGQGFIFNRMG